MHRVEHPNPQFMRENWVKVNELGQFDFKKCKKDSVVLHVTKLDKSKQLFVNDKKIEIKEIDSLFFSFDISDCVTEVANY